MEVFLVPYRGEKINPNPVDDKDAYNYNATQTVLVDIKCLPHLHIGSFWKNKRFVGTPFYSHYTFRHLLVNRTTSYITDSSANKHLTYLRNRTGSGFTACYPERAKVDSHGF